MVALGTVVAVGLISALVLSGLSRRPVGGLRPSSPAAPTTQSPTPSPTLARQEPPSVQGALDQLALALTQGVNDGDLSRGSANRIDHDVEEALKKYQEGDLDKALEKLDELQRKVTEMESKGDITPSLAGKLHQGISDLAAAMEAAPPSTDEGDE